MVVEIVNSVLNDVGRSDLIPEYRRGSDPRLTTTNVNVMSAFTFEELTKVKDKLYSLMKGPEEGGRSKASAAYNACNKAIRLLKDVDSVSVTDHQTFVAALKKVIDRSDRKWVWLTFGDDYYSPAFVKQIEYIPRRGEESSHTVIKLAWKMPGKAESSGKNLYFYRSDLSNEPDSGETFDDVDDDAPKTKKKKSQPKTVSEILKSRGVYLDNDDLNAEYERYTTLAGNLIGRQGTRVLGRGLAFYSVKTGYYSDWETNKVQQVDSDGVPAKMVLDISTGDKFEDKLSYTIGRFWHDNRDDKPASMEFWGLKTRPKIPTHPYLRVFDFNRHMFAMIHAESLTTCEANPDLKTKLVLPFRDVNFIDLLMNSTSSSLEDIVIGKSGGVIVMCSGAPGTGKTLTAEVYSEVMNRPLYTVQASQLGTNEKDLEERLQSVLRRAERWNAILMIDEADVYVRARGEDIQQNAIVGVFLRVLEYYRGVLFLTTNKPVDIDDAIISRLTAHIRYHLPTGDLLKKIWEVLSAQFKVALSDATLEQLMVAWPEISGRTIKNLLKLVTFLKEEPTIEAFKKVSGYLDLS